MEIKNKLKIKLNIKKFFCFKSNQKIWGLGIGDWAQSPIPNPQSPIPNAFFNN